MGETKLSEYVKICNITLMFESFLNKEDFTIWELTMAEIILKKLIKDFVDYVKWQEGKGLKLICMGVQLILMVQPGSLTHLKAKTKQPAWRTKIKPEDMEYQTAMKIWF